MRKFLLIFIVLFAGCKHGPQVTIGDGDVADNLIACSDWKGNKSTMTYPASDRYYAYTPLTYQAFLDYYSTGVPIQNASQCVSNAVKSGLDCYALTCAGGTCTKGVYSFTPWSKTDGYIFISPTDNQAALAYFKMVIQ